MASGSLTEVYLEELADLYDAEMQGLRLLPRLREEARAPKLRDALARHWDETRLHLERLQLIFTHWGGRIDPRHCAGFAGIVQEADDRLHEPATDEARDALVLGIAHRMEHYEIAGYGCARSYARRLNRPDEARLLQETLEEEGRADRRLTEISETQTEESAVPAFVQARTGPFTATPPHGDKFRG
jgi:ferritin-like metal-binding protein YciE